MAIGALVTEQMKLELNVGYANLRYADNAYTPSGAPLALKGYAIQALNFINPPWDVSAAVNYAVPLSARDKLQLRLQYIFHSKNTRPLMTEVPSSPSYAPADVADPSTRLVNMRASWKHDEWDVGLFVNNAFNSHPLLNAYQDTPTSNLITHSTFRPRTIGLAANYAF
jgi:outer membrane receptor protein involved in Fe transport